MSLGLLGKKVGMTQIFTEDGTCVPVTVVQAGPCKVLQKKTDEKEAYTAVQVGFQEKKESRTSKPLLGHFKKYKATPTRYLHEFRVTPEELGKLEDGSDIKADIFEVGKHVDVIGTSKGRGFTGVMKRYNFAGAPAGHGTHEAFRHPGSVGQASTPGRVFKGQKMPGRYGNAQITTQSLQVVDIDPDKNLMLIKGAVPGPNGGFVVIQHAVKYINRKEKQIQDNKRPVNPLKASKRGG